MIMKVQQKKNFGRLNKMNTKENNLDIGGIVINLTNGEIEAYTHEGWNNKSIQEQYKFVVLMLIERLRQGELLY